MEITPDEALQFLMEGNKRFSEDHMENEDRGSDRREAVLTQQTPFAIIVACSDSRVSPEILFDQGIGRLFVVRVAGNVIGATESDSVNFAALYLKASLILVLGHESCGAIRAVVDNQAQGIPAVAKLIQDAIHEDKDIKQATLANISFGVGLLKNSLQLAPLINKKKLKVVGGYYNLGTGRVDFFNI